MTAVLCRSDFAFGDLKSRIATVFLVLPPDRLGTYARWLRLMVTQSLQDMARAPGKPAAPVGMGKPDVPAQIYGKKSCPWSGREIGRAHV